MMLFPLLLPFLFFLFVGKISDAAPLNTTSVLESSPVIEVLCVVDYSTYRLHSEGKDPTKIEESMKYYYAAFWKTVDIYFQQLNIKIVLKDVIIARNKFQDNHYLKVNRHRIIGTNGLSSDLLNTFGKHIYRNKSLHNHDIAVYITQFDICQDVKANKSCEIQSHVFTFKNEACKINYNLNMSRSVAMITDKKNIFTGIRNAVFAIGNLLGISKDGEYRAKKCKSTDGYFMSGNIEFASPYKFKWSKCSINSLKKTFNTTSNGLSCLFKKSKKKEIDLSEAPLPGQLIPVDDYCEQITNFKSRIYTSYKCAELPCRYGDDDESIIKGPAIEGSWCWDHDRCFLGSCIKYGLSDDQLYWMNIDDIWIPKPI